MNSRTTGNNSKRGTQRKSASTQAGRYVREEMHDLRKGKSTPKNRKQAVAIGLSRARKAGVKVPIRSKQASGTKKAVASARGRTAKGKSTSRQAQLH